MDRAQLQPLLLLDLKETGKELGRGAYGVVTEVIVSGTTCAAKKLHDVIIQVREFVYTFNSITQIISVGVHFEKIW